MSFPLGQIVATPGALNAMREADEDAFTYLARHSLGDWGIVDAEDKRANDRALLEGTRLFSAYLLKDGETRVWVITESDRSVTTILLPDEY